MAQSLLSKGSYAESWRKHLLFSNANVKEKLPAVWCSTDFGGPGTIFGEIMRGNMRLTSGRYFNNQMLIVVGPVQELLSR